MKADEQIADEVLGPPISIDGYEPTVMRNFIRNKLLLPAIRAARKEALEQVRGALTAPYDSYYERYRNALVVIDLALADDSSVKKGGQ